MSNDTATLDGVELRHNQTGMIGWLADWCAPHDREWITRGLVETVEHNSGGLGGFSYRLTPAGLHMTTATPARYVCKGCGAESPTGIGYASTVAGPMPAPGEGCQNSHA